MDCLQLQSPTRKEMDYPQSQMVPLLMKEQRLVCKSFIPFESVYSLSISIEEGAGSNQLAIFGSMVGLLLLLAVIIGASFVLML